MSIEAAAEMGFKREQAQRALALIEAAAAPPDTFAVAMDLARFVMIPLDEATEALIVGPRRRLRRLGIVVPEDGDVLASVRAQVDGQAQAYSTTFYGVWDVQEARGETIPHAVVRAIERVFGPRQG